MNDRISEFLKYLKIEKNYSSNTIKYYEIDIDEFKNYLNFLNIFQNFNTFLLKLFNHNLYTCMSNLQHLAKNN